MTLLSQKETDQALILGLSGEIIMDMVPDMKAEIERATAGSSHPALILDLGEVTFMDSSGIGFLIGLRRSCEERGKTMSLTNPSPPIKKLLDMLRLSDYFALSAPPASV